MVEVNQPIASPQSGTTPPVAAPQAPEFSQSGTTPAPSVEPGQPGQTPATATPASRTVPYSRFQEINKKLRKAQQELETRGNRYNPEDLDDIRQHPYVQDLEMKRAESDLRQGANEILERYPDLPPIVKKAILRNPRGYVKADDQSVPEGLLSIEEYCEQVMEEVEAGGTPSSVPQPKQVPVAGSNEPGTTQIGSTPSEVDAILKKPVGEWSDDDMKIIDEYKKKNK